jgi:predicted transcriptional regulator
MCLELEKSLYTIADYIIAMVTTIQISEELQTKLSERKLSEKERYEDVIWDLLEDSMELSEETKRNIKEAEKDIKAGRVHTLEEVKKELGI